MFSIFSKKNDSGEKNLWLTCVLFKSPRTLLAGFSPIPRFERRSSTFPKNENFLIKCIRKSFSIFSTNSYFLLQLNRQTFWIAWHCRWSQSLKKNFPSKWNIYFYNILKNCSKYKIFKWRKKIVYLTIFGKPNRSQYLLFWMSLRWSITNNALWYILLQKEFTVYLNKITMKNHSENKNLKR